MIIANEDMLLLRKATSLVHDRVNQVGKAMCLEFRHVVVYQRANDFEAIASTVRASLDTLDVLLRCPTSKHKNARRSYRRSLHREARVAKMLARM